MDRVKGFLYSLLSRKFLVAVAASIIAYNAGIADGSLSNEELLTIIGPLLAFIGVEGVADIKSRESGSVRVQ